MLARQRPDCAPACWPAAPAIGAWASLSAGYIIAQQWDDAPWRFIAGLGVVCAIGACVAPRRVALVALSISAMCFGAAIFETRIDAGVTGNPPPMRDRAIVLVEGVVLEDPQHGPPNPGAFARFVNMPPVSRFALRATSLTDRNGPRLINGTLLVRSHDAVAHVRAGDTVRIGGFYAPITGPSNPGEPDARRWANQESVIGRMLVSSSSAIERFDAPHGFGARITSLGLRWRANVQSRARAWLDRSTHTGVESDAGRATLGALLLGARDDQALNEVSDAMRRIGVAHLLSISGLHLGALVWMLVIALRMLGVRGGVEALLVAAVILLYITVVPARTPVIRAAIMALAYLVASLGGRRHHPLAVLAWTGVVVLLWKPLELWSPGYQLSFGVVAAIIVLPNAVQRRLRPVTIQNAHPTFWMRAMRKLESAVLVALCAWIVAAPLVIYHFGIFSVFGAATSLLLFPIVIATIGIGAVALLLAPLLPSVSGALGSLLVSLGDLLSMATLTLDAIPHSSMTFPPVSEAWVVISTIVLIWLVLRGSWRRLQDVAVGALILTWLLLFQSPLATPSINGARIDTFSVDDGTCHLIRAGRDAILWDAGSRRLWIGERDLPRTIRTLGAWPVRTIVLSHPNLDHYAAIPDLIAPLGVQQLLVSPTVLEVAADDPDGPVAAMLDVVQNTGVTVRPIVAGDQLHLGQATMTFLHPEPDDAWRSHNDGSLVATLQVETSSGVRTALFTGDIERGAIRALQQRHPDLHADIMEAPHHGSARPFAADFVLDVNPSVVIQSTGMRRAQDDRWSHVRDGREWLTTATDGAITVFMHSDGQITTGAMRQVTANISEASGRSTNTAR